jgi:hypothetical protein
MDVNLIEDSCSICMVLVRREEHDKLELVELAELAALAALSPEATEEDIIWV